jgi:hypothetical protein
LFELYSYYEAFFLQASKMTESTPANMQALFRAHGMEITGPPLDINAFSL